MLSWHLFIFRGDKGDTIRASYIHHLDESKKTAAVGEITRRFSLNENTFTVGGSYAVDSLTVFKSKLNNHGKLGVLLQHEIIPKSLVTLSSELDTKALDKTPKFGLALALKPWSQQVTGELKDTFERIKLKCDLSTSFFLSRD